MSLNHVLAGLTKDPALRKQIVREIERLKHDPQLLRKYLDEVTGATPSAPQDEDPRARLRARIADAKKRRTGGNRR